METLLKWLPKKKLPILIRYGLATVMVAVCFAVMTLVEAQSGIASYFLMYPAIFLAALLFDRGSGIYATVLSTLLLVASIQYEGGPVALWKPYWLPLSLFFLVGVGLAALTELLRIGWERAIEAERVKDLLYRELHHRTKNDFAMAASVLSLQARSQSNAEVKAALTTAVGRLVSLSKAHERLNPSLEGDGDNVRMHEYLDAICHALKGSLDHADAVSLQVACDQIELSMRRAVPVGLIVNELVTNAFKHAFDGGRAGAISVSLSRGQDSKDLMLVIEDDGMGCPDGAASGVGSQLVQLLVQQLKGDMERANAARGCRVRVSFPETD